MDSSTQQQQQQQAAAATQAQAVDKYMEQFSELFEEELVAVGESDASPQTMEDLKACIEAGLTVWGQPMTLPDEHVY